MHTLYFWRKNGKTLSALETLVKIADESVIDKVFAIVKKGKNITKFNVLDASLNEIFLSKVGESYE